MLTNCRTINGTNELDFGILDCARFNEDKIVTSNSNGSLSIFSHCELVSSIPIQMSGSIQMKLDCNSGDQIATCNDLGFVHLLSTDGILIDSFRAHEAECWAVKFIKSNDAVFLTGADDATFKIWDSRTGYKASTFTGTFHEAGVCCINWSPHDHNQFITGSYDNSFALWDARNLSKFTGPLRHEKMGGGVWRAEWHPQNQNIILLTCMYAGNSILDLGTGTCAQFNSPNPSISYGGIFSSPANVIACSFYDKKVSLWSLEENV